MKTIIKVTYIDTPKQRFVAMQNATGVDLIPVIKTVVA